MEPGQEVDMNKLKDWISEMIQVKGEELYRYKGILAVKGVDQRFVFQGVHMLFDGEFVGEWDVPREKRQSKFVFIGKNLNREELITSFKACLAAELRFAVGDQVLAKVKGGWKQGTIMRCWDASNPYRVQPYRIKINDAGVEVFGPEDTDRVVRALDSEIPEPTAAKAAQ